MAVRGDEVASSIEAHVREAIEKMVGEIRSSVEDVREVVDQQLKAAMQSVQADVNALSFLPHIKKTIGELEEGLTTAAPAGGDASRLKAALQAIERGKSQVDVLNSLLEQCLEFGSRAALLILRGETFSGWKGVGFAAHGGNDETIKRFNAAPGLVPELDEVLRNERVVEWDGLNVSSRFGVSGSARAVLVPMVIKDKVAAAIYVDAVTQDVGKLDRNSIEILVFTTGLLVDTLAIRKKSPSPSLSDTGVGARPAAKPVPARAPAPQAAPSTLTRQTPTPAAPARPAPPPAAPPPPPPPAPEPPHSDATVAFGAAQMREAAGLSARQSFPGRTAVPPPPPAAPPAADLGGAAARGHEDRPATQFVPPAGLSRGGALAGGGTEEAKKHDEARRFARLLVSEIKLYNESKVDQGRKSHDLYERLKEDIDRSRQMYDERIPEEVRKGSNYFYDELVRILADGNADALGL